MNDRAPAAHAAYAELILTLVDARSDPATVRFDHQLAQAVADGRLDDDTARTLRWWQRESVRGVRDHLADVLPPLLDALEAAAARAAASVEEADDDGPRPIDPESDTEDNSDETPNESVIDIDAAKRRDGPGMTTSSRSAVLNLLQDRSDRRRRMLVAGLVAANGPIEPGRTEREGRR